MSLEALSQLVRKSEIRDALKAILDWCENNIACRNCGGKDFTRKSEYVYICNRCGYENVFLGFRWDDVGVKPQLLYKLVLEGVLGVTYRSNSGTFYMLRDPDLVRKALSLPEGRYVPPDLFDVIHGYEDIKKVLLKIARGAKFNVLMVGPPSSGKSLFLHELARLPGSYLVVAGTSTQAGIRDVLIEYEPWLLLIDEMEKVRSPKELSVLLSALDPGVVVVTMRKRRVYKRIDLRVVAACNSTFGIPNELLSRFLVFRLKPYDDDTLKSVIIHVLTGREGKSRRFAEYVAGKVVDELKARDVRTAIQVARACETLEDVDFMIEVMKKYRGGLG